MTALSELAGLVVGGTTRRSQLATATGLSRAAVAQRVDLLIAKGLLVETGTVVTDRGRPPLTLQLASRTSVVCAVDLGATHSTVAVAELGGAVLAEATEELDINDEYGRRTHRPAPADRPHCWPPPTTPAAMSGRSASASPARSRPVPVR